MSRTYAAEYCDYAVEGIKFFLSIQTLLADLRKDYPFIPWLQVSLGVEHPREQLAKAAGALRSLDDVTYLRIEAHGVMIVDAVPHGYMNVDRLKHEITENLLARITLHVQNMGVETDLPGREENELNKRWVKRVVEHLHEAIVKAGS